MEIFLSIFSEIKNGLTEFSQSMTFSVIKFLIGIYVIVIFVDVVLLLFQRGIRGNLRNTFFGMDLPKDLVHKRSKIKNRWKKIRQRLQSENESEYKVAIIEADNVLDELVKGLGYAGENLGERLQNIPEDEIEVRENLLRAHEVRNKIIHDDNFVLTKEKAQETMDDYEKFLHYFMVLE